MLIAQEPAKKYIWLVVGSILGWAEKVPSFGPTFATYSVCHIAANLNVFNLLLEHSPERGESYGSKPLP